jgi:hypothetical protein
MRTFTITDDNNITVYATREEAKKQEGCQTFASQKELEALAAEWPLSRCIETWNSFAGVAPFDELKPVKKFTDRKTAVARIWTALQRMEAPAAPPALPRAPKKARASHKATAPDGAPTAREGTRKAKVLELIRRPQGASLAEIMSQTAWRSHTVRGFISGSLVKRMGLPIESFRRDSGDRAYRLTQ